MKKLIIHIGTHKTGSSSLQNALFTIRNEIKNKDWYYFSPPRNSNTSSIIETKLINGDIKYNIPDELPDGLKKTVQNNVIVSAEHLFAINKKEIIEKFYEDIKDTFDSIRIIVYLRRQDKLAISFKQQACKGIKKNHMLSSMLCGHSDNPLPETNKNIIEYLSYDKKLDLWTAIFGKENVIVRNFESLIGNSISSDFKETLNLPFEIPEKRTNESVPRIYSLLSHNFIKNNISRSCILKIRPFISKKGGKITPKRSDAIDFYSLFHNSNLNLKNNYNIIFDDNFDNYPVSDTYSLSNNDIDEIQDILKEMSKKTLNNEDINKIISISKKINSFDSSISLELMSIANKLKKS